MCSCRENAVLMKRKVKLLAFHNLDLITRKKREISTASKSFIIHFPQKGFLKSVFYVKKINYLKQTPCYAVESLKFKQKIGLLKARIKDAWKTENSTCLVSTTNKILYQSVNQIGKMLFIKISENQIKLNLLCTYFEENIFIQFDHVYLRISGKKIESLSFVSEVIFSMRIIWGKCSKLVKFCDVEGIFTLNVKL